MSTPRSEKGFLSAIKVAEAKVAELDEKLTDATGDLENEILGDKADAEVELATLKMKFEEFQEKQASDDEDPEVVTPEAEQATVEPKAEPARPKKDDGLPEIDSTVLVTVLRGGYMVNPYTHDKFIQGQSRKSVVDRWLRSQIKAKIMAVVETE